jgi:hypothetical protein
MRLLRTHNNPVPSTIDLKYSDEPITFKTVDENGVAVSSTWTLTYDREWMYSENLGSLSATPFVYSVTGATATYNPPLRTTEKQSVRQHVILQVVPSDGSPTRNLTITIS